MLVLLGIIAMETARPKPLDWRPSYTATDKIPFGCFVLFNELPNLFPNSAVESFGESVYEVLTKKENASNANYLFVNNGIDFDEQETHKLLDYVHRGNDVFIASTYFGGFLSDTLNLKMGSAYTVKEDTVTATLTNNAFSKSEFLYAKGLDKTHFTSVDSLNTTILGYMRYNPKTNFLLEEVDTTKNIARANFIKVAFGKGNFYMNSTPQAYSNYYMLRGNKDYVSHTFSYLGNRPLYWDNYKKTGRIVIDSPMRFVLNQTSLKWAYYLTMTGLLVFFVFRAKREQRIIPVVEPLRNSSVEFARTVGSLYYQHKDYTDLIAKKLNYFLEYVRSHYYLDTNTINEKTARDLAIKSGKSMAQTKELVDFIVYLKNKARHTEQDIIQLNKKITSFKK